MVLDKKLVFLIHNASAFQLLSFLVYAKSIKNHVVEIKSVTDQMMALDKKARLEIDSSDEIGQLKV